MELLNRLRDEIIKQGALLDTLRPYMDMRDGLDIDRAWHFAISQLKALSRDYADEMKRLAQGVVDAQR